MAFLTLVASSALGQTIRLSVGESETIQVREPISKVQVLNPHIADVADYSAKGATVVGIAAGQTELFLTAGGRQMKYLVIVTAVQTGQLMRQVKSYLGHIEGIYPRVFGEKIVLDGEALTAEDYMRAEQTVRLFGDSVRNWVRIRPQAAQQLTEAFQRAGLVDVRASSYEGRLVIEGAVGSKEEAKKADVLLQSMGIRAENLLQVGRGRTVLIDVSFVEMVRSGHHNIGLAYPQLFGGGATLQGNLSLYPKANTQNSSVTLQIAGPQTSAQLNVLSENGAIRTLAQPRLICSSGEKASLLVGGEIPIVTTTQFMVDVKYKEFGIKLEIEPVADNLGNISARLLAEVSDVDPSLARGDYPGFRTRRVNTMVAVKEGSTIVLSGLYSNIESKAISRFPGLGNIPILGEFFKNRDMRDSRTSLAIFITPRVVGPQHQWVKKTVSEIQRLYDEYEKKMGWELFD
ncbi:MAG TPA: pilus assembly protein N-terminal domain-containing protein [Polyangia bacterium]